MNFYVREKNSSAMFLVRLLCFMIAIATAICELCPPGEDLGWYIEDMTCHRGCSSNGTILYDTIRICDMQNLYINGVTIFVNGCLNGGKRYKLLGCSCMNTGYFGYICEKSCEYTIVSEEDCYRLYRYPEELGYEYE